MLRRTLASNLCIATESRCRIACAGTAAWRNFSSGKCQLVHEEVEEALDGAAGKPRPDPFPYSQATPNPGQKQFLYKVQVVTGNVRGAGTSASAFLKLLCSNGESRVFQVAENMGFERGTVETFKLPVDRDLGAVKTVFVRRAKTGVSETGAGWFLDKVLVRGPSGELVSFPCKQWLGDSEEGDVQGGQRH